jgi:hypothetical protein
MGPFKTYDLGYNKFSQKTNIQKKIWPCTLRSTWPWKMAGDK